MSKDVRRILERIEELARVKQAPVLVAIDGRGGAGKSTLAAAITAQMPAAVIDGDDFYAGGTAEQWDAMTPAQRAEHCIGWRLQRPVLAALARGRTATWQPYDWESDDGSLSDPVVLHPAPVVILEGVYSARSELADLLDLRVLLDVPNAVREGRLQRREGEHYRAEWEARWASAEAYYFETSMPPQAFDLVVHSTDATGW